MSETKPVATFEEHAPGTDAEVGLDDLTPEEIKRIDRKLDRRLVVTCGVMYCISRIDRTNLSAASIAGMVEDLNLIDYRYSTLALVFFVTYTLFQAPATVLTRKLSPKPFPASICVAWGIVMLGHGFVWQWGATIPLRLLLGLFDAGLFPSCLYLISTWYTRYQLHKRYAWFYLIGCVADGFGVILAYDLMKIVGLAGYNGWRWIFIMEGILTVLIGCAGYFALLDFPDKQMMNEIEAFTFKKWAVHGLDLKVWGFALIFLFVTTTSCAIAYFITIILRDMGFSVTASQLLVAPPYALAAVFLIILSWIGDRYKTKAPIIIALTILTIAGLAIMGYATGSGVRYFGVFLITGAANANLPTIMAYQANNIRGQWKRAFCSVSLVAFGGIGGMAGRLIFRTQDAPLYRPGLWVAMTANGLVIIISRILGIHFKRCNKRPTNAK